MSSLVNGGANPDWFQIISFWPIWVPDRLQSSAGLISPVSSEPLQAHQRLIQQSNLRGKKLFV